MRILKLKLGFWVEMVEMVGFNVLFVGFWIEMVEMVEMVGFNVLFVGF